MRSFAERSDHTEVRRVFFFLLFVDADPAVPQGFMISSPISDGFGGFTSSFLEMLRDEFPKTSLFSTAMLSDALSWKREDTEVRLPCPAAVSVS